jgi:hypothetical protein
MISIRLAFGSAAVAIAASSALGAQSAATKTSALEFSIRVSCVAPSSTVANRSAYSGARTALAILPVESRGHGLA